MKHPITQKPSCTVEEPSRKQRPMPASYGREKTEKKINEEKGRKIGNKKKKTYELKRRIEEEDDGEDEIMEDKNKGTQEKEDSPEDEEDDGEDESGLGEEEEDGDGEDEGDDDEEAEDEEEEEEGEGGGDEDEDETEENDEDEDDVGNREQRPEVGIFDYSMSGGGHDHVALHLARKSDRGPLTCKQYCGNVKRWDLEREDEDMKKLVKNTLLYGLVNNSYRTVSRVLISAFVERWHPETTSFHMPFGEMTVTLDDVQQLLNLPIVGKPMEEHKTGNNLSHEWVSVCLGIPAKTVFVEMNKSKGNSVRTQWLINHLSKDGSERCNVQPVQAARGYLLLLLGCTLFQDRTGDKVNVKYLHYLQDLDKLFEWAWGAGALAYLYRMLGKASTFQSKAVAGYLTLLEAWIYEHFSSLRTAPALPVHKGMLRTNKWKAGIHMAPNLAAIHLKYLRGELDKVNWTPYRGIEADPHDVVWFFGCLVIDNIVEPYHPNWVVRQFGRIQEKPCAPIRAKFASLKKTKAYIAKYNTREDDFVNYMRFLVPEADRGKHAKVDGESTAKYLEWYTSVANTKLNFDRQQASEGQWLPKAIELLEEYVAKGVTMTKEKMHNGFKTVLDVLKQGCSTSAVETGASSSSVKRKATAAEKGKKKLNEKSRGKLNEKAKGKSIRKGKDKPST